MELFLEFLNQNLNKVNFLLVQMISDGREIVNYFLRIIFCRDVSCIVIMIIDIFYLVHDRVLFFFFQSTA